MDKKEQNRQVEMTHSMLAGKDPTGRGIRGMIRYGRPVCGRVLGAC